MNIDSTTIKIGLLVLLCMWGFMTAALRGARIRATNGGIAILAAYVTVVAHYLFVGDSITDTTNGILLCGFMLLPLALAVGSGYGAIAPLQWGMAVLWVSMAVYTLINLPMAVLGTEDAFVDGNYVGLAPNANMLGAYLALLGVPAFTEAARRHPRATVRWMSVFLLLSSLFVIYQTRSRAAMLVVGTSTLFLTLSSRRLHQGRKLAVVLVLIVAGAGAYVQFREKYGEADLFSTRTILLLQRLTAIDERPWLGWGFNSDVYNYFDESNFFPAMEKGNTVLQAFEEFGIPLGAALMLGLYYMLWRRACRIRQHPSGMAFSALLIGSGTHLMFETWLFNFPALLSIIFWTVLLLSDYVQAVTAAPPERLQAQDKRSPISGPQIASS